MINISTTGEQYFEINSASQCATGTQRQGITGFSGFRWRLL